LSEQIASSSHRTRFDARMPASAMLATLVVFDCRAGVQLGTIDAFLAQLCLRRKPTLLTTDNDFKYAAKQSPAADLGGKPVNRPRLPPAPVPASFKSRFIQRSQFLRWSWAKR
jgi:hypothetical protein